MASRGIAVLRYEKRTKEHAARLAKQEHLTVKEEVIDDALAAAKLLRLDPCQPLEALQERLARRPCHRGGAADFGHDVGAGHASLFVVLAQRAQNDSTLLQFLGTHKQGHQRARPVGRLHL